MITIKNAIELIEEIRPKKCREVNGRLQGGFPDHDSEVGKAIDMAIKALEKQMPTSMDLEGDGYADGVIIYDTWICPRCGKHYELEYDNYDYCPNCGQSLDWEDYDDK